MFRRELFHILAAAHCFTTPATSSRTLMGGLIMGRRHVTSMHVTARGRSAGATLLQQAAYADGRRASAVLRGLLTATYAHVHAASCAQPSRPPRATLLMSICRFAELTRRATRMAHSVGKHELISLAKHFATMRYATTDSQSWMLGDKAKPNIITEIFFS